MSRCGLKEFECLRAGECDYERVARPEYSVARPTDLNYQSSWELYVVMGPSDWKTSSWVEKVGQPIELSKSARDVVLAIDISGSMDARDFQTPAGETLQRLQGVKNVVGSFIEGREGDRMALIVFGSKAYVQSPLTQDLQTIGPAT